MAHDTIAFAKNQETGTINTGKSWSEKFLLFVQKFDDSSNCFPSMHVSVATLTALLALGTLGPWVFLFPLLIACSCTFTKQHYLLDLPAGAALGWAGLGGLWGLWLANVSHAV